MNDIGLHILLFALVGLGIVVLSAVFSEVDDVRALKEQGVAEVFTPGAPTQEIVDFIRGAVSVAD